MSELSIPMLKNQRVNNISSNNVLHKPTQNPSPKRYSYLDHGSLALFHQTLGAILSAGKLQASEETIVLKLFLCVMDIDVLQESASITHRHILHSQTWGILYFL